MSKKKEGVEDTTTNEETTNTGGREAGEQKAPLMTILGSDGTLRLQVPEGTDNAVLRKWESPDGKTGTKCELVFKSIAGQITHIEENEGDYGVSLIVTLTYDAVDDSMPGEDRIAFNVGTPFGEDFMKKLPNIYLPSMVKIQPYSFTDDNGKLRRGVSITQGDEKVLNYFSEKDADGNWTYKEDFPEPTGKESNADDWKLYFLQCRQFLLEYTREKMIPAINAPEVEQDPNDTF